MAESKELENPGRFDFSTFERIMRPPDQEEEDFAARLGVNLNKVRSWRRRGICFYDADRLAIRMGMHPSLIWGEEYWNPVPRKAFDYKERKK